MATLDFVREWRTVQAFPDYEVSNDGIVRRRVPTTPGRAGQPRPAGHIMSLTVAHNGYHIVHLTLNGKTKQNFVHRLVAEAFIGPRPPGHFVAHGDGNPINNRVSNLRWATPTENMADRDAHGRTKRGISHSNAKLTEADVLTIRQRRLAGEPYYKIAADYEVGVTNVCAICKEHTWRHILPPTKP